MITFMRRYRRGLQGGLLLVIAAFVASLFVFGSSGFTGKGEQADSVATVNGETISRRAVPGPVSVGARVLLASQSRPTLARAGRAAGSAPARGGRDGDRARSSTSAPPPRAWASPTRSSTPPSTPCASSRTTAASRWTATAASSRCAAWRPSRSCGASSPCARSSASWSGGVRVTDAEVEQAWGLRREEVRAGWALVELAPLVAAATASADEEWPSISRVTPTSSSSPSAARCSTCRSCPRT